MKKRTPILAALLAAPITFGGGASAVAFDDVPAIGTSGPLTPMKVAPEVVAACKPYALDGAQIRGRVFSAAMDLKDASGKPIGTLESADGGWELKDADGKTIAKASDSAGENGRVLTVTGCAGEPVGQVIEARAGWRGERTIEIRDAGGKTIARSKEIGYLQGKWSLEGSGGSLSFEDDHWALDSWRVRGGIDGRLGAFAVVANSGANRRESQSRNREREHHGRGDR